jgi:CHAD domain-containing protein
MRTLWRELSERAAEMDKTRTQDLSASLPLSLDQSVEAFPAMTEWLGRLDRVDHDWTRLELPGTKTPWFLDSVRKEYRRGYRIVGAGLWSASDRRLHKLRKAVKQTQYHLELLQKACPTRLPHEHDLWRRLGELLGRHHDLSVFRETLSHSRLDQRPRLLTESFGAALEQERDELRRTICREASQVYLVRPRAFARYLLCAWKSWHRRVGQE